MIYQRNEAKINVLESIINENITFLGCIDEYVLLEGEKFDAFKAKIKDIIGKIITKIKAIKDWIVEKISSLIEKIKNAKFGIDLKSELRKAEEAVKHNKSVSNESTNILHEEMSREHLRELLDEKIECVNYITMLKVMRRFQSYLQSNTVSYNQPAPKVSDLLYHLAEKPVYDIKEFTDKLEVKREYTYKTFIEYFSSISRDINSILTKPFMDKCLNYYDGIILSLESILERINKNVSTDVKDLKDLLDEYNNTEEEEKGAQEKNKLALYNEFVSVVRQFFATFLETVASYNSHFMKCRNILLAAQQKTA